MFNNYIYNKYIHCKYNYNYISNDYIYIVYYNYIYNIYNRMMTSFRKISVLLELTGCRTGKSCHLGHLGMHHVTVAF